MNAEQEMNEAMDRNAIQKEFMTKQLRHAEKVAQELRVKLGLEVADTAEPRSLLEEAVQAVEGPTIEKIKQRREQWSSLIEEGLAWARAEESNEQGEQFEELLAWWRSESESDAQKTIPKAIEYGSIDLNIIGYALGECIPALRDRRREGSTEAAEMGIAFYLLGKISRMVSAYSEGQRPSDDTWMDVTVYSMMGRRVRDRGSWG